MLANGIKLKYKEKGESTFKELAGLKEVPELGIEPEKVENTCLSDSVKQYENGIGDAGDLEYKFKYDNSGENSSYRVLRKAQENKLTLTFQEELPDGTIFEFDAQPSIRLGAGAVNGVIDFILKMSLQSAITVTDPVATPSV